MRKLLAKDDPILRQATYRLALTDFTSKFVERLASEMLTLMMIENGVGLAAPQIGVRNRMIVVAFDPFVLINPRITDKSGTQIEREGCLSFPGEFYDVTRFDEIVVEFQDLTSGYAQRTFEKFESVVIQHEVDHLNGILFIDRIGQGWTIVEPDSTETAL